MLENQLIAHTADLNTVLQWVTDEAAKILGWEKLEVELSKFKLVDDVEQKRLIVTLNQGSQKPLISDEAIAEQLGFNLAEERKKRYQNMLDEAREQQKFQQELTKMQNSLSNQIMNSSQTGSGMQYDQQAVISQAEQLVEQLSQLDPSSRRSQLHALQSEDYVMYSVVVQRLEEQQKALTQEAKQQVAGQGQPGQGQGPQG
jgi:hypothetical protein